MIHIITVHFKTDKWIDLQLKQIDKHVTDYKVWSYCDGFDISPHKHKFHFCENSGVTVKTEYKNHLLKLNALTENVVWDEDTKDDDILIFMDSDAFPVNDINDYVVEKLSKYPLLAVYRPENGGDVIPHPSFTCSTVAFWMEDLFPRKKIWGGVHGGELGTSDPGGKLYKYLSRNNIEWYRMRRTQSLTEHPVHFTIYDDIVYHHNAGSRDRTCRLDDNNDIKVEYDEAEMFTMISEENFFENETIHNN